MNRTLSIATLRRYDACKLPWRITVLAGVLGYTPAEDEEVPLAAWRATTQDLIWALRCFPDGAELARKVADYAAKTARDAVMAAQHARPRTWTEYVAVVAADAEHAARIAERAARIAALVVAPEAASEHADRAVGHAADAVHFAAYAAGVAPEVRLRAGPEYWANMRTYVLDILTPAPCGAGAPLEVP
jgi:hypothetical protein